MEKFVWKGWKKPAQSPNSPQEHIIIGGNFVYELVLANALKINNFEKLGSRVRNYMKARKGKLPDVIIVTDRQMEAYKELFPKHVRGAPTEIRYPIFAGIPLKTRRQWNVAQ